MKKLSLVALFAGFAMVPPPVAASGLLSDGGPVFRTVPSRADALRAPENTPSSGRISGGPSRQQADTAPAPVAVTPPPARLIQQVEEKPRQAAQQPIKLPADRAQADVAVASRQAAPQQAIPLNLEPEKPRQTRQSPPPAARTTATAQPVAARAGANAQGAAAAQSRPVSEAGLKVLSDADVRLYRELFRLQRDKQRAEVAARLSRLEDPVLMGHLIAERLLHPEITAPYSDLQSWLANYKDHAPARQIYALANQRQPRGQTHESPEIPTKGMTKYKDHDSRYRNQGVGEGDRANARTRARMLDRLKTHRVRKEYDKALALLSKSTTRDLLGPETHANVSLRLARTMLNDGQFKMSEMLADRVVRDSDSPQPEGLWISGFSAYRQNRFDEAASTFRRLVYTVPPQSRYYARAAWWAARSYEQLDRQSMARVFLTMASHDRHTFYGQLAQSKLGKQPTFSWVVPALKPDDRQKLVKDPAIRRVIALSQIGEHGLAQHELRLAYERMPYDMDESLLALSIQLDLPATSMILARNLRERNKEYIAGLYPYSRSWKPTGGFKVDQALMLAIMRQESAFHPAIRSRVGAMGLMQVMPGTADQVRRMQGKQPTSRWLLNQPDFNMAISQDYILYLQQEFSDNLIYMIAGYNAGPGNVRKWQRRLGAEDDPLLFVESIPFEETRTYVMRVMANLWIYRTYFYGKDPTLTAMARNQWPTQVAMVKLTDIDG